MPVITRSQYRVRMLECTRMFTNTIENPCIIQVIARNLHARDLVTMKQVSKDSRFVDVINHELKKLKEYKDKVKYTIARIRNYLNDTEITESKENKISVISNMFDFLCENKWFIDDTKVSKNFKKVVHQKLIDLIKEYPPFKENAIKYLGVLFGLKPPKDYYNSKLGIAQHGMFDMNNHFVNINKF